MPKDVYFPRWEVLPHSEKEISEILSKFSMRVTKEECMDLPDEVTVDVPVKLKPDQLKAYNQMRKELVAFLDSGVAVAKVSLTKALRLLQITSGFVAVEGTEGQELDEPIHRFDDTPRENALRELLTELSSTGKVLIWAVWKENYATIRRVCDELGIKYVECHGEISDAQKKRNIEAFNTDDSIGAYIGHPGSGGIGVNLVVAPFSIRYSRTASLEQWLQSRARNHRGGQTKKVTHYEIFAENTFDEIQKNVLAQKLQMSERLLQEIKQQL
jgi:SNF2 family DNA or RNA helicase